MKKVLFIVAVFCMPFVVFSQETEKVKTEPVNEVKLNLATTVFIFYPEISYERSLTKDLGLGVAAAVALKNDILYNFQITPYFRFYFGSKPVRSFFIEANAALVGLDDAYFSDFLNSDRDRQNVTDFGLGLAVGYKFINNRGFIGEIYSGVGRTFGDRAYPRLGISVGKQF